MLPRMDPICACCGAVRGAGGFCRSVLRGGHSAWLQHAPHLLLLLLHLLQPRSSSSSPAPAPQRQQQQRPAASQSNFSVHFHVTWTRNINLASYANICWRKRSCGFCRRSPLWATRRLLPFFFFFFFFLLSTVVFRLAMLQSLLYPALAICAPHRTATLDIWE